MPGHDLIAVAALDQRHHGLGDQTPQHRLPLVCPRELEEDDVADPVVARVVPLHLKPVPGVEGAVVEGTLCGVPAPALLVAPDLALHHPLEVRVGEEVADSGELLGLWLDAGAALGEGTADRDLLARRALACLKANHTETILLQRLQVRLFNDEIGAGQNCSWNIFQVVMKLSEEEQFSVWSFDRIAVVLFCTLKISLFLMTT